MASDVPEISIRVPGRPTILTMRRPEWVRLPDGWQLGGFVDHAELNAFDPLWATDRVILDHPGQTPVFVSLRRQIIGPRSYGGLPNVYLKFAACHAPRPHPAWTIDEEADRRK